MSKNIVIIGASTGAMVAKQLCKTLPDSHRVVVIEQNEFAYWPIGALRAAVQPGFENQVVSALDHLLPAKSRHILISGHKVASLESDVIVLESGTTDFPDGRIPFERAILAMGSTYAFPCRPAAPTIEGTKSALKNLQGKVKDAKSILIVGGGPVGVEFAGEVYSAHPGKSITLVSGSKTLIPSTKNAKLHSKLLSQLEKAGVRVILDDRLKVEDVETKALDQMTKFKTEAGVEIESDFIFNGFGSQPNSSLVKEADASAVDRAGFVQVNGDLTLKSTKLEKYFALGDLNDMVGGKTFMAASGQVPVLAANIVAQVSGSKKFKTASSPPAVMAIPLGPKGGAIQLPFATLGEWTVSLIKGKGLFVSNFNSTYK